MLIYFIFLNQQFITQGTLADCGSYSITIYIKTESTCEKKIKMKKNKKEKEKEKKTKDKY